MMAGKSILKTIGAKLAFLVNAPKAELIRALLVIPVVGGLVYGFSDNFGLYLDTAETRCLPETVYVGYPRSSQLKHGDVVSFIATDTQMFGIYTGKRIAKVITGMTGDTIRSDESGVWVNGKQIALRSDVTLAKLQVRSLAPLNINRKLEVGELFVMGTMPRSFDSRYWGVLHDSDVERLVKPLI